MGRKLCVIELMCKIEKINFILSGRCSVVIVRRCRGSIWLCTYVWCLRCAYHISSDVVWFDVMFNYFYVCDVVSSVYFLCLTLSVSYISL